MPFLRAISVLNARLVHHTGTMIRFTTSQLTNLPPADTSCQVILLDGQRVEGSFHRHPANPYIGGAALVRWIKSWVSWNRPVDVTVHQEERGQTIRLQMRTAAGATPQRSQLQRRVSAEASRLARTTNPRRRRRAYSQWERDPRLRRFALLAWGADCQISGCTFCRAFPAHLRPAIVEVHHLNHLSAGGPDSPMNVCLVCASHHSLIHRAPASTLLACNGYMARVRVNDVVLEVRRDVRALW